MSIGLRIGLDFDNTLVLYDRAFAHYGRIMGFLPEGFAGSKVEVRRHVRALSDGPAKWTKLQASVYGPGVELAEPAPGVWAFLDRCRLEKAAVYIVSHKTETATADPDGMNLRDAARAWIARHGLTDPAKGGVHPNTVFFETTRREKIERIAALGCTHFVDDLAEVFLESGFPATTERHLLLHGGTAPPGPYQVHCSWGDVADVLFARRPDGRP